MEIRKVTIKKGDTAVALRLKNMGYVSLSDERTQNIFAGIIKGLFGIKGEMSAVHRPNFNVPQYQDKGNSEVFRAVKR